jgi:hypothetical protein
MPKLLSAERLTAGYGDSIVLDRAQVVRRSASEELLKRPEILDRLVAVA